MDWWSCLAQSGAQPSQRRLNLKSPTAARQGHLNWHTRLMNLSRPDTAEKPLLDIHEGLLSTQHKESYAETVSAVVGDAATQRKSSPQSSLADSLRRSALYACWYAARPPFATQFSWILERLIIWLQVAAVSSF